MEVEGEAPEMVGASFGLATERSERQGRGTGEGRDSWEDLEGVLTVRGRM